MFCFFLGQVLILSLDEILVKIHDFLVTFSNQLYWQCWRPSLPGLIKQIHSTKVAFFLRRIFRPIANIYTYMYVYMHICDKHNLSYICIFSFSLLLYSSFLILGPNFLDSCLLMWFHPPPHTQNSFSFVSLLYVSKSINQFQPISALNLEVGEPRSSWRRRV